jgi:hypothetical protein
MRIHDFQRGAYRGLDKKQLGRELIEDDAVAVEVAQGAEQARKVVRCR